MAILGGIGVIFAMTREHPANALLTVLVILSLVSIFCSVMVTRMANLMEQLGGAPDD